MEIDKKDLLKSQNNVFNNIFNNTICEDVNETIKILKEHKIDPNEICTEIEWDNDELKDKSEEEILMIKGIRQFINNIFNKYQLKCAELVVTEQDNIEKETFSTEEEKKKTLMERTQAQTMNLIISLIINSMNWGNMNGTKFAEGKYNNYLQGLEKIYIDLKKDNKNLENENTDLKDELKKLKDKKFLGLFKVNK